MSVEFKIKSLTPEELRLSFRLGRTLFRRVVLPAIPALVVLFFIEYMLSLWLPSVFPAFVMFIFTGVLTPWFYSLAWVAASRGKVTSEQGWGGFRAMFENRSLMLYEFLARLGISALMVFVFVGLIFVFSVFLGDPGSSEPSPSIWNSEWSQHSFNITLFFLLSLWFFDNGAGFRTILSIYLKNPTVKLVVGLSQLGLIRNPFFITKWAFIMLVCLLVFVMSGSIPVVGVIAMFLFLYVVCLNVIWFRMIYLDMEELEPEPEVVVEKDFVITQTD